MKRKDNRAAIKQLTVCSMMVALGVVLLGIGSLFEVLDISMAVLASFCVIIAVIEYGKGAPWMVYAATSILALILIPNRLPAVFFTCFFGFYPILKDKLERKSKIFKWILKEIIFNVSLAAMMVIYFLLVPESLSAESLSIPFINLPLPWLLAFFVLLCEIVFVLYDIALKRITIFYIVKLRHRLKLK